MVRVRGVPFGEGHGQQLLLYEMCGVNVKERGKAPVHRVVQCLKFARGNCKELEGVEMSEADRDGWWLFGCMYLPKTELLPRVGHRGFSWVTEESAGWWEVELYERNVELLQTEMKAWFPLSGVTSARPQIWHPSRLKDREVSISGNPQSFVVFNKAVWRLEKWSLAGLGESEVISVPEERLGWSIVSLTTVSRSCVRRVTGKVRDMMKRGARQRRVQGTVEGFSRLDWSMFLDMTVPDSKIKTLSWVRVEKERKTFIDGGLTLTNLLVKGMEQEVRYESDRELGLLERAECDFSLSTLPRELVVGNYRMLRLERGHTVRTCTKLKVKYAFVMGESVGKVLLQATYKDILFQHSKILELLRVPPPPLDPSLCAPSLPPHEPLQINDRQGEQQEKADRK